ncbi:2-amino-4-hydroxy-6-hydroxymethyldihydropteridine diphosphokinase [Rhodobacteraceae bacterium 63075]|nr:2-amino-4-hydroxy-6-hydroxymethyldihydropteridine diphosphokinase [Rhodobacteraceae bacterium 63075]
MPESQTFLIALGANLPFAESPPEVTIAKALSDFNEFGLEITATSSLYHTPCFPAGAGPDYVNAVASAKANLEAAEVLKRLHKLELRYGRERSVRWGQRTLDLDLVAADNTVLPDRNGYQRWQSLSAERQRELAPETLVLPHPRLAERAFVLVPMAEIAPDWEHPITGKTTREMLDALEDAEKEGVKAL